MGALRHIETDARTIEDGGVAFVVRRATRRPHAPEPKQDGDPFARPEPALFVADLSPTHFALLNKYNVLDRHLLLVTREDIDQDAPLDAADFDALAAAMAGEQVLGFYNGGAVAGASQPHKHLQVVRLPVSAQHDLPIESLIEPGAASRIRGLPVRHGFARLHEAAGPGRARELLARYRELRAALGVEAGPYNLLVTSGWMLLVPRRAASFAGIPVNSLAFAGSLFVRDDEELRTLERIGPMAVLRGVALTEELP